MTDDGEHDPSKLPPGDIIPPGQKSSPGSVTQIYADIAAQITQYTDRPDLFLEAIERHDPGFIKSINDEAREFSRKFRRSRFRFGRFQAYSALLMALCAAGLVLYIIYDLSQRGLLTFWALLGLGIFYAITQSGASGFVKIASQIADIAKGDKKD